jgi:hypothetical protein
MNIPNESQACKSTSHITPMSIPDNKLLGLAIATEWTENAEDELARKQIRELISTIESTARKGGHLLDFQFMNDASYIQSPLKSYGSEMLEFLKTTSQKYDPQGIFQEKQNGGFLLSKVG